MTSLPGGPVLIAAFWIGICGIVYAYVGFPVLLALLSRSRRRALDGAGKDAAPAEVVTIIIPAYNEGQSLEAKIRNVLASDYPRSLLDIIVISDASTDQTDDIARAFEADGVRLVVQPTRRGKTAGLNRVMGLARGTVVVFTDANAQYASATIRTLVAYLRNPRVGLVTGYTRYTLTDTGDVAEATNLYTSLERTIKRAESAWGCCVGADGAIFAMRRSLYRELRDDDINDFVLPLRVIDQGYECVFAEDAFCSESPGKNVESEFRRQSRITNRTLRALWRNAHLFNPIRFPVFAFLLLSHKVVRFLVPMFMALSAVALLLLALSSGAYLLAGIGVLLAVAVAASSSARFPIVPARLVSNRLLRFLNIFLMMNVAVLNGWWKFLSGANDVTWQHDRSAA